MAPARGATGAKAPLITSFAPTSDTRGSCRPSSGRSSRSHAGVFFSRSDARCITARPLSRVEPPNVADQYAAVIYKQLWDFRSGARVGSPLLKGQSEVFKKAQLQAYAASQRTNDISHVRNIARAVTPQEIDRAAAYCGSQPPDIVKTIDQEIWIPHPRHKS